MIQLLRIQDHTGRGPYRPNFQKHWADPDHDQRNPANYIDLSDAMREVRARGLRHGRDRYGSGFRTLEQLQRWFSPSERQRLAAFGYQLVRLEVDKIIGESMRQVIFWRNRPLYEDVTVLEWPADVRVRQYP